MADYYTENDVKESIDAGNIYIEPNIRGTLEEIVDQESGNPTLLSIVPGTLSCFMQVKNVPDENRILFKDGSYFKCILTPTFNGQTLTNLSFTGTFGLMNADTETVTEYPMFLVGGLSLTKNLWKKTIDPITGEEWILDGEPINVVLGDTFQFAFSWWDYADPKFRYLLIPYFIGNGEYSATSWFNGLNPNIMDGGYQAGIPLNNETGQIFAGYLCGQSTEGTTYPGEDSTTGGGGGTFYNRNDEIHATPLPSLQAIDFGFTSLYNPNPADMRAICRWLWSDSFTDNIKKNYASPFENILGFNFIALPEGTLSVDNGKLAPAHFVIGNTDSNIETLEITSGNQYLDLDCGTIEVPEYWQNFIDYNTNFAIWLPYIGFRQLKPDDILQATENNGCYLNVIYHIDLLTGCAVAEIISALKDRETGNILEHLLYSFSTNVFYSTPISGANYMSMYNQQMSASLGSLNNIVSSAKQVVSGDIIGGLTNLYTGQAQAKRQYETAKPDYGRGGSNGGNAGYFSYKKPYLIRTQVIGQAPKNYKSLVGVPSQIYARLGDLSGYTEIESVVVDTLTHCTDDEKSEIITLLKEGVIL